MAPTEQGYRMLCMACKGPLKLGDEDDAAERFRTFSFGPDAETVTISVMGMVCSDCVDLDMLSLRRMMYEVVFQQREHDGSPMTVVPHG